MIDINTVKINDWRENIFFLSLVIYVGVLPFSEALVSISAGILLFQALILQSWKHPSISLRSPKTLYLFISVFVVYVFGMFLTKDYHFALYELKKVIFWIVIPPAVFLSPKIAENKLRFVFKVFVVAVTVASLIHLGKLIFANNLHLSDFREVSMISHIRFSLQVVLAIILSGWFILHKINRNPNAETILYIIISVWLIVFLFLLKSLLGLLAFGITCSVALYLFIKNQKDKKIQKWAILLIVIGFVLPTIFVGKAVADFYNYNDETPEFDEQRTPSGNLYSHDLKNIIRENGTLVYTFICEPELEKEWNKRSKINYSDSINGFPLNSTLIRYMASKGLKKDSVGISFLTDDDIRLIEQGVTNYKFKNSRFSIYPRIYETIWELDYYFKTGDPNNKTLAQRIEFVKASIFLIKRNLFFGIGTGNWKIDYNEAYDKMQSKLLPEKRGPSHNQYLNYMVKFGLIGFFWIMFALIAPVFFEKQQRNLILILFLIAIATANFGDSNLETHMGLSFFILFYSLFLWNSTDNMRISD
ncbi:MAG: O-antigen ligase family protein [Prolixibacteraceae bacterium]|nr:O-antigen ligase family protein [Prolixibacteraceae bacterium]